MAEYETPENRAFKAPVENAINSYVFDPLQNFVGTALGMGHKQYYDGPGKSRDHNNFTDGGGMLNPLNQGAAVIDLFKGLF